MAIKWGIYLIVLVLFAFIPQMHLERIHQWVFSVKNKKKRIYFQHKKGRDLVFKISKLEANLLVNTKTEVILPEYKFYTALILKFLADTNRYGLKIKKVLTELRPILINDQKFEEKIFDEISGGVFQFIAVSFITWSFIYISNQMIPEIKVSVILYFVIGIMQFFGLILFLFSSQYFQTKIFKSFGEAISELLIFNAQFEIGLPVNLVLKDSNILNGTFSTHRNFVEQFIFFQESIERLKQSGISPKNDGQILINNLFDAQNEKWQKFQRIISISKFLHLALIYLPAYFLYLASIYKFFMEQ